jgi:hypothetical protein
VKNGLFPFSLKLSEVKLLSYFQVWDFFFPASTSSVIVSSAEPTDPVKYHNSNSNSIAGITTNPWTGNTGSMVKVSSNRSASPGIVNKVPWSSPVLPPRSTPTPPPTSIG